MQCSRLCYCSVLSYCKHTHTHPFNGPFSGTTRVSRYQKGKTNLDFTEARDSEWQWHQLSHMQVCISLQTDNHASTPPLKFFTGRMPFLPPNQQYQSTEVTSTEGTCVSIPLQNMVVCVSVLGPSCRLLTASPGRWIGGRPPDMVAICDLSS